MTFKKRNRTAASQKRPATLAELRNGEEGILDRLDLPDDIARRLMELGFLPETQLFLPEPPPAVERAYFGSMAVK